jgi:hypothetical protein
MMIQTHIETYTHIRTSDKPLLYAFDRFPKEFQKNWISLIDIRYLLIWTATFFIITISTVILHQQIDSVKEVQVVTEYHTNYAQLVFEPQIERNKNSETNNIKSNTSLNDIPFDINNSMKGIRAPVVSHTYSPGKKQGVINDGYLQKYNSLGKNSIESAPIENKPLNLLQIIESNETNTDPLIADLGSLTSHASKQLASSLSEIMKTSDMQTKLNGDPTTNEYQLKGGHITEASFKTVIGETATKQQIVYQNVTRSNTEMETVAETEIDQKLNSYDKQIARSPEQITSIIMSHNQSIQDCYKQILKQRSEIRGKIMLRFSVTPSGTIGNIEIINSTINDDGLVQCILRRIKRWNDFGTCDHKLGDIFYRQTYIFGY